MKRFREMPPLVRALQLWPLLSIILYLVFSTGSLSLQTKAVAGETIELLVGFKKGAAIEPLPAAVISWQRIPGSSIVRMKIPSYQTDAVIEQLRQRRDVRYVERSRRGNFQGDVRPEALVTSDWYQEIDGKAISSLSWGNGALVAVLDTGIDLENPAMDSRAFRNPGEVDRDLKDNDANGFVDDWRGWDFGDGDNDPQDENGHGTEVSSIIMAVAPHCRILPVKIDQGGNGFFESADLVEGIYYALSVGARVINLSLTADGELASVSEAIRAAHDAGVVVVAAGGNDSGTVEFPASMHETIAVGSLYGDQPAWFSPAGPELDIMAPGVAVECITLGGITWFVSGTSLSCAMVSGAVAVLRGMNEHMKKATTRNLLLSGVRDLGAPGRDTLFGEGALDGMRLFQAAAPDLELPSHPFYAFPRSVLIPVTFHLPPTDTASLVYIGGMTPTGTLWWLDQRGTWRNAQQDRVAPVAALGPSSETIAGALFGEDGAFPPFDPTGLFCGLYRWGIAVTDTSGQLLGPVTWDWMLLF